MPPASTSKRKSKKDVKTESAAAAAEPIRDIEPIVLQLPIPPQRLNELMEIEEIPSVLEYNPIISDPQPYHVVNNFISENDIIPTMDDHKTMPTQSAIPANTNTSTLAPSSDTSLSTDNGTSHMSKGKSSSMCFWCCHLIDHMEFGMPIRYDVCHKSFTTFGCFCSLECVAAYNFSLHMGSDRVWEIHSWIQMLASRYGYVGNVRPAPSRYALQMFNGPLTIEEFRNVHKNLARTCIMNIPPFVHVNSQLEMLNTSFLDSSSHDATDKTKAAKKQKPAIAVAKPIETKLPSSFMTSTV